MAKMPVKLSVSILFGVFGGWILLIRAELMFMEMNHTTPAQFSNLMDNQHILMVGDCLMRYQYLSLVHLLTTNTFISPDVRPNMLNELDFKNDWISFYNTSSKIFAPYEHCDCFRKPTFAEFSKDVYENRYYFNHNRNISVSYLQYFGDHQQFSGHWHPTDGTSVHQYKAPDLEYIQPKWIYHSLDQVLTNIGAKLTPKPSVLVLNAGHWPHKWNDASHLQKTLNLALTLFKRVIYKTTNYDRNKKHTSSHDSAACAHPGIECMDLSWTKYLSPKDYWDNLHFMPTVYRDVNIQFIHHVVENKILSLTPLNASHYMQIVVIGDKHYLVDNEGVLRPFRTDYSTYDDVCKGELNKRRRVIMHGRTAVKHLLGESISDVCAFISRS